MMFEKKTQTRTETKEDAPPADATGGDAEAAAQAAATDALLDEIDGVLEENAEQFVKDYVQKGGE